MFRLHKKRIIITIIIVTIVTNIIVLLVKLTPDSPVTEIKRAGDFISEARRTNADVYSKKLFNEARILYDSAMAGWRMENEKFIFLRDYENVIMYAGLSSEKARQAAEYSRTKISNFQVKLKERIDSLNSLIKKNNDLFTSYPLNAEIRNRISNGKLLLDEAEVAFGKNQYMEANRKISDSEYLLIHAYENSVELLKNYFRSYSTWQKWIDKTIKDSKRNHEYSIIIDKVSRKYYGYQNGVIKHVFEAELGKNWIGDKRMRGDHATPEGMYRIIRKLESGKTRYYKALLINYPDNEDVRSFKKEVSSGSIPPSATPGGLIEIHGNGGKGTDWTEGCIALTDKEMDIVFRMVKVGTAVTIVGSTIELEKVLGNEL